MNGTVNQPNLDPCVSRPSGGHHLQLARRQEEEQGLLLPRVRISQGILGVCVCVFNCVCVTEREKEREYVIICLNYGFFQLCISPCFQGTSFMSHVITILLAGDSQSKQNRNKLN